MEKVFQTSDEKDKQRHQMDLKLQAKHHKVEELKRLD
mgnify:CR=1 FL=1